MRKTVIDAFFQRYKEPPECVVRCPGRVNLIGEHTDYNDGFVLPMAIDRAMWIACRRTTNKTVRLDSLDRKGSVVFEIGDAQPADPAWPSWGTYPWAVANQLTKDPETATISTGIEGVIGSEIPVGAGLSSSAALELAIARALLATSDQPWNARAMALLCHRAESQDVGVACGVMDQMIVAIAQEGCTLLIDCRSLESSAIPMPPDLVAAVLDTGTRRDLGSTGDSAFNQRREQCSEAAATLGVASLRGVEPEALQGAGLALSGIPLRRARHVVSENQRVLAFVQALRTTDLAKLGVLMSQSHSSLRDDYAVVTPALDQIVEVAREAPGCVGARMTGAGFGGCAVALVERRAAQDFAAAVEAGYAHRGPFLDPSGAPSTGQVHLCEATNGVESECSGSV